MRSYKRIGYLILVTLLVSATITVVATIRNKNQDQQKKDVKVLRRADKIKVHPSKQEIGESETPIADYVAPESADPKERAKKEAKGKKYNRKHTAVDPDLINVADIYYWDEGFPSLPVAQSDVVILGEVSNAQAYLSSDKTGVYSEFTLQISQVLKNNKHSSLTTGTSIVVEREGGRVRFPSGQITRMYVAKLGMPIVGRKYVFFLTHDFPRQIHRDEDYRILTGYELRGGHVFPLDSSGVVNFDEHRNADETAFLNEVQDAVKNFSQSSTK